MRTPTPDQDDYLRFKNECERAGHASQYIVLDDRSDGKTHRYCPICCLTMPPRYPLGPAIDWAWQHHIR